MIEFEIECLDIVEYSDIKTLLIMPSFLNIVPGYCEFIRLKSE